MPLSETWGQKRSGFLEKIISAAQSSYNVIESVRSVPGFASFKRKRLGKVKTRALKTGRCGTSSVSAPPAIPQGSH
jgi:hypothetical protein